MTVAKCISAMVNGAWFNKEYADICMSAILRILVKYKESMTSLEI